MITYKSISRVGSRPVNERCSSLYDDLFSLRGWKTEEINGIQFELNSILVEKWEGNYWLYRVGRVCRVSFVLPV